MSKDIQRLILVDAFAILFRAYYAIPYMSSPEGKPTNAVYGFTRILLNVIDELQPDKIAIAFDSEGPNFRDEIYDLYKANREAPPDDFIPQISLTQRVVDSLSIPRFEMKGWEADDIIGTLATQSGPENNLETIIVTGDQDLFQLVDDDSMVKVWIPGIRGKASVMYDEAGVIEKIGVENSQITDYKGLAGDSSDNIPGIRGVGPKTAVALLSKYGSVEKLYDSIDQILRESTEQRATSNQERDFKVEAKELGIGKAVLKKLVTERENAFLSKELATISKEVPINIDLDECKLSLYDKVEVRNIFQEFGFKSLMHLLPDDEYEMDVQEALF
jgi:DNA polymerase-1